MAKLVQHERDGGNRLPQTSYMYIIDGGTLLCLHNHNTQLTCYGISASSVWAQASR